MKINRGCNILALGQQILTSINNQDQKKLRRIDDEL